MTHVSSRATGYFSVLHRDPLILFAPDWEVLSPVSAAWRILDTWAPRAARLMVSPSWFVDQPRARMLEQRLGELTNGRRHVALAASCATAEETHRLQAEGMAAVHCAVSSLVREDLFVPPPDRRPRYDAVYDARWTDFKRHQLAGGIRSLALIAGPSVREAPCTLRYSLRARVAMRHATWLSSPWGVTKRRWLPPQEVAAAYNASRVGLCLSQVEGVMFASIQYLLAGLPVVTTRNRGGRDEFFAEPFVRWVDDDRQAVAAAVEELAHLDLDPWAIREATLQRMQAHRLRLQEWLRAAIRADGGQPGRWADGWPVGLPNKLREPPVRAAEVLAELGLA